jgi:phosphatidylglycerophosphate synthase
MDRDAGGDGVGSITVRTRPDGAWRIAVETGCGEFLHVIARGMETLICHGFATILWRRERFDWEGSGVPNALAGIHLFLVPALWLWAILSLLKLIGIGLIIAGPSDIFDGLLARALRQVTSFGSRLDSLADTPIGFSAMGWLLIDRPAVIRDHPFLLSTLTLTAIVALWTGWRKFRRLAILHPASGRAAGVAAYLFLIHTFLANAYVQPLFYLVILLAFIVAAEVLVIQFTYENLEGPVQSPLLAYVLSDRRGPGTV